MWRGSIIPENNKKRACQSARHELEFGLSDSSGLFFKTKWRKTGF